MSEIITGKAVPEVLREALKEVLSQKDIMQAVLEVDEISSFTVRNILNGQKLTDNSYNTAIKLIEYAKNKCSILEKELQAQKNIILEYAA